MFNAFKQPDRAMIRRFSRMLLLCLPAAAGVACPMLAPAMREAPLVRENLRPELPAREFVATEGELRTARDLERWVETAAPTDVALALGALGLQGLQVVHRSHRRNPAGGDSDVSWQLDPSLVAAQIGGAMLGDQPPLRLLLAPSEDAWWPLEPAEGRAWVEAASAAGLKLLLADLHIHTAASHDSSAPLREVLRAAERSGLDVVSITEHERLAFDFVRQVHDDMRASGELRRDLILIPGIEVSSAEGHVLAYFIETPIPPAMDAAATVRAIRERGGLAIVAHPYRPGSGIHGPRAERVGFDGSEVVSGADVFPTSFQRAQARAGAFGPARLGSSDAHFSAWVGSAATMLAVTEATPQGVRDALIAGRTLPVARSGLVAAWARGLAKPGVAGVLFALNLPLAVVEEARSVVAGWLRASDVWLRTSWEAPIEEAWSLIRATRLPGRWRDPWDPLHAPPFPVALGARWGSLRLEFGLPLAVWGRLPQGQAVRVPWNGDPRPAALDSAAGAEFVWPDGWRIDAGWEWIF